MVRVPPHFASGYCKPSTPQGFWNEFDYLSTDSGGSYIGCSLTASLDQSKTLGWHFPFGAKPLLPHIRASANYLFARGGVSFAYNVAIYLRGLFVNAVLVVPVLLTASAYTLSYYAFRDTVASPTHLGYIFNRFGLRHFFLSLDLFFVVIVVVGINVLIQPQSRTSITGAFNRGTRLLSTLVLVLLFTFLVELQSLILDEVLASQSKSLFVFSTNLARSVTAALSSLGLGVGLIANKLAQFVKDASRSLGLGVTIARQSTILLIYVAGILLPLLTWVVLWVICFYLSYWGILVAQRDPALPVSMAYLYVGTAAVLLALSFLMRPNANSLHTLYRQRLRDAFLSVRMQDGHLKKFDTPLSELDCRSGPYHLINAALVNQSWSMKTHGRNADFFFFSPLFVGSRSTGYVRTSDVENVATDFDMATALTVSGAPPAVGPLTPLLALLNLRLGYWLRNPRWLARAKPRGQQRWSVSEFRRRQNFFANYYFVPELLGMLSEYFKSVYLIGGSKLTTLSFYQLLQRGCRVILVVDADPDPHMDFGNFAILERYAFVDLGIRMNMPWQKIADEHLATSNSIDTRTGTSKLNGPHCAVGEVTYPNNRLSLATRTTTFWITRSATAISHTKPRLIGGSPRNNSKSIAHSVFTLLTDFSPVLIHSCTSVRPRLGNRSCSSTNCSG